MCRRWYCHVSAEGKVISVQSCVKQHNGQVSLLRFTTKDQEPRTKDLHLPRVLSLSHYLHKLQSTWTNWTGDMCFFTELGISASSPELRRLVALPDSATHWTRVFWRFTYWRIGSLACIIISQKPRLNIRAEHQTANRSIVDASYQVWPACQMHSIYGSNNFSSVEEFC
jgi:hypothetical protein